MTGDRCVVCEASDTVSVTTAMGERLYCRACFHGWRKSIPDFNYSSAAMCSKGTASARQQSQFSFIKPFVTDGASILEIGCASGEFAAAVRASLSVGRYDGIELSPVGEQARPHLDRLHNRPLRELLQQNDIDGPYDMIVMSHILEHLEDLHAELAAITQVLKQAGAVFIEVPNRSGHPNLPLDDNVSHLHFFSSASLMKLLSDHGLESQAVETGARLDARYADSLRVVARRFLPPQPDRMLLRNDPLLVNDEKFVVWGAGSVALEILANFMDSNRIDFFVDGNPVKHGSRCLGLPVYGPHALGLQPRTILIATTEFADEICEEIARRYPNVGHRVIRIGDILDNGLDGRRR